MGDDNRARTRGRADGSSWSRVIPLLEAKGLRVDAVQLPLTSQADDVAAVQGAIARVACLLLLVAHSFGGAVITQAGNDGKVAGLVHAAAFAPAEGESPLDLTLATLPPFLQHVQQDQFGFLKLTPAGIREDFAPDLSDSEQTVLAATQGPTSLVALSAAISTPAWRIKPSWFVIVAHGTVVLPALQAMFAAYHAATWTKPRRVVPALRRPFLHPRKAARDAQ